MLRCRASPIAFTFLAAGPTKRALREWSAFDLLDHVQVVELGLAIDES
jgi:hypothetical protein